MRIDNTDDHVIEFFSLDKEPGFDAADPGTIEPVDLCTGCATDSFEPELLRTLEIDHPPYGDGEYKCRQCGTRLWDEPLNISYGWLPTIRLADRIGPTSPALALAMIDGIRQLSQPTPPRANEDKIPF